MDEQMEAWMKTAAPSEEHEFLRRMEGTWRATVKLWMDPSSPPHVTTGTMTSKMVLGGRYLHSDYVGDPSPMGDYAGFGVDGFDRIKGKYFGAWMDSMSTGWMALEGTVDGEVRTMQTTITMPDGKTVPSRAVTTIVGDGEYRYESFVESPDGEFQNMEIVYTR